MKNEFSVYVVSDGKSHYYELISNYLVDSSHVLRIFRYYKIGYKDTEVCIRQFNADAWEQAYIEVPYEISTND